MFSYLQTQTDVSSPRELQLMAVKIEKELGPVEILVNNASLMPMTSTPQLKNDEIEKIISVNLGSYIMVRDFFTISIRRQCHTFTWYMVACWLYNFNK